MTRGRIITFLERGPATSLEIAMCLQVPINTVKNLCNDMQDMGVVRKQGHVKRPGQPGRPAAIWEIAA